MKRRDRQTAKLLSVSESTVGTTLSADAAVGATTLVVDDVSVFDESGSLLVGSQVVAYTAIDDDAGTVTLADPLTAAADTDDFVARWSTLYDEVETVLSAQVAVLGDRDQADTLTVEVADTVDVVTGDRGRDGENCTIESDGDVWTLVHVSGRPSKARGLRFESDDVYALTASDITAGTATIPLSHKPVDESVKLWWRTVAQEPTEYTVDATAQTITLPLGSFAAVGDRVWVHYAYRPSLPRTAPETGPVPFVRVGSTMGYNYNWTSVAWPAGAQPGDVFVFAQMARSAAVNTCTDARASLVVDSILADEVGNVDTVRIWTGLVGDVAVPLAASATALGGVQQDVFGLFVLRPDSPISVDLARVSDSGAEPVGGTTPIPALAGSGSGAVGVCFSVRKSAVTFSHWWASPPWDYDYTNDQVGSWARISFATQANPIVGSTPAVAADAWRGFALGLTEG